MIDKIFQWALVWSIGCTTNLEGREKLEVFLRDLAISKKRKVFPDDLSIYEYEFKDKDEEWVPWTKQLERFDIDQRLSYH